jgi:hypothetical protein
MKLITKEYFNAYLLQKLQNLINPVIYTAGYSYTNILAAVRFEVFTTVTIKNAIFWDVMLVPRLRIFLP